MCFQNNLKGEYKYEDKEILINNQDVFSETKIRNLSFYNLTESETEYTLVITLNGIPCKFIIDDCQYTTYQNIAEANSVSEINVEIQFDEMFLSNYNNQINYIIIAENQAIPVSEYDIIMFYTVSVVHTLPDEIEIICDDEDIENSKNIFERTSGIYESYGNSEFVAIQSIQENEYTINSNLVKTIDTSKILRVEINGKVGEYAILLFIDNEMIKLTENFSDVFILQENSFFSKEYTLDYSFEDTGQVYMVAIPLNQNETFVFCSRKYLYVFE